MKKYVKINSTLSVNVYDGLISEDKTLTDEKIANRLKVQTLWQDLSCRIVKGTYYYPSIIKNWAVVKELSRLDKITIGEEVDVLPDDKEKKDYAEKLYNDLKVKYESLSKIVDNPFKEETPKITKSKKESTTNNLLDGEEN